MSPLSNDLAALIGFPCEAVLWGVNVTLFLLSFIILRHGPNRRLGNPTVYLTYLIFLCCTTHFALEFNHFIATMSTTGVINYSNETNQLVGADILISFTDLLGDIVLIYRCWMVWGKNYYVIVLPFLTAVSGFACIIAVAIILLTTSPSSPAPPLALVPLGLAGYTLPLCTNVLVTSLILYRIWYASRPPPDVSIPVARDVTRAMALIIESGALYLLFQFVFVVLFAISNPAEAILAVMAVQVYGIAPALIVIRVGLGTSFEHTRDESTNLAWVPRREDTCTSATAYTDALATSTDLEGMEGGVYQNKKE